MPTEEGLDFLLRQLDEDKSLLLGCFRDPQGNFRSRMPLFTYNSWPQDKKEILQRLVRRRLVEMRFLIPGDEEFTLWVLTRSSAEMQGDLEDLRKAYSEIGGAQVIFLTEEGEKFIKNLKCMNQAG